MVNVNTKECHDTSLLPVRNTLKKSEIKPAQADLYNSKAHDYNSFQWWRQLSQRVTPSQI